MLILISFHIPYLKKTIGLLLHPKELAERKCGIQIDQGLRRKICQPFGFAEIYIKKFLLEKKDTINTSYETVQYFEQPT
jgi:hypothetical protein